MKNTMIFKKTALAASIALLTACGGSGSDTTASNDTSTTSVGVITGFGSMYEGGTRHNTDNAVITINGEIGDESQVQVGYKCTFVGTVSADGLDGTATSVTCNDELEGYVLGVTTDVDGNVTSLDVMGQTVNITMDTVFESNTYASISEVMADDIVEVYGYSDGEGTIVATLVETKDINDLDLDIEIKGLISNLGDTTFNIGTLIVDFSGANVEPVLANDLYVEVKADAAPTDNGDGVMTLVATKVELEDDGDMDIEGDSGQELDVTGLVSDMIPASEGSLGGFTFNGSTFIDYEFVDIEDTFVITEGMTITVEGYIDAEGVFIPEEVVEEPETEAETEGYVTAVAEGTISISMDNGTTVETFTVNNETRMRDELTHDQYFNLTKVSEGDYVEIEYYTLDSGEMIATEVELEAAPAPESNTSM